MVSSNQLKRIFLIFLLLATLSIAQRIDYKLREGHPHRRFSLSTQAPLSKALNDLAPDIIPHIDLLLNHITRVENAVRVSLGRQRIDSNAPVQPCNQGIDKAYRSQICRAFGIRGFAAPAYNCGADIHGVLLSRNDAPGYTLDDLYEAVFNRGAAIKRRVKDVARRVINNFTSPGTPFNYSYKTATAHCSLSAVCMTREGEHWRNAITISSGGTDDFVLDGQQQNIAEYVRVVNGKLGDHMLMRLPVYDDGTVERVTLDNTTTIIQSYAGNPNPSCFRQILVEENPAMLSALDLADHSSQIVEDSLTTSNLAILLLPLGLNLIPLSFIAQVSTITILLYTILSDVLTVVPLAIKGVELVMIQKQKYRSVVTRVVSPALRNSTKPLASGGEIWGAGCEIKEEVRKTGYILIATAIFFMILGVGFEIAAKKYTTWRMGKQQRVGKLENGDMNIIADGDMSSWDEYGPGSSSGGGSMGDDGVGTGAVAERYSSDFERDVLHKKGFWSLK